MDSMDWISSPLLEDSSVKITPTFDDSFAPVLDTKVPEKLKSLAPLPSLPLVVKYETSISLLFSNFLPISIFSD